MSRFWFLLLALLQVDISIAQQDLKDYLEADEAVIKNAVYKKGIKSVTFHKSNVPNSYPFIKLGKGEQLTLSFDVFSHEMKDYQYTIEHCDYQWKSSNLLASDYIEGSQLGYIDQYKRSFNTYQKYINYTLKFPNNEMKPAISGNYILKVSESGYEDSVILTRRFMVVGQKVQIEGNIKEPTFARFRETKQEIDFYVDHSNISVADPFREIKVVVRQNGRWDNAIIGLQPNQIRNKELNFNYEEENLFNGLNEFRIFDTRATKYTRRGVAKIYLDSLYQAVLRTDEDRSYKSFLSSKDINGNRIIAYEGGQNPDNHADYMNTYFRLNSNYTPKKGEDIYIFGELSDWQTKERFKMEYYAGSRQYEAKVKLKQGYYNYMYVVEDRNGTINATLLEGNHQETENDYLILVYYYSQYLESYKLVGVKSMNSKVDEN